MAEGTHDHDRLPGERRPVERRGLAQLARARLRDRRPREEHPDRVEGDAAESADATSAIDAPEEVVEEQRRRRSQPAEQAHRPADALAAELEVAEAAHLEHLERSVVGLGASQIATTGSCYRVLTDGQTRERDGVPRSRTEKRQ